MRFLVKTLVDITKTGVRSPLSGKQAKQEQNFSSFMQTLGLRTNIKAEHPPKMIYDAAGGKGFGDKFKGRQNLWIFEFEVEYDEALSVDLLEHDFDLVPIITGLDETVKFSETVFRTSDPKEKNIVFNML